MSKITNDKVDCLMVVVVILMMTFVIHQISLGIIKGYFFEISPVEVKVKGSDDSIIDCNCTDSQNQDYWGDYRGSVIVTYDDNTSVIPSDIFSTQDLKLLRGLTKKIQRQYGSRIKRASELFNVNEKLILAVITIESRGNKIAKSSSGALGLMQIKPSTAVMLSEFKYLGSRKEVAKNLFHPYKNILGGAEYLRYLGERFKSQEAVLAAYNMGPTKVARLLKNGFNPSGHRYVQKVESILSII